MVHPGIGLDWIINLGENSSAGQIQYAKKIDFDVFHGSYLKMDIFSETIPVEDSSVNIYMLLGKLGKEMLK